MRFSCYFSNFCGSFLKQIERKNVQLPQQKKYPNFVIRFGRATVWHVSCKLNKAFFESFVILIFTIVHFVLFLCKTIGRYATTAARAGFACESPSHFFPFFDFYAQANPVMATPHLYVLGGNLQRRKGIILMMTTTVQTTAAK